MNTEIAKSETKAVGLHTPRAQETILKSDVIIPKILLMQGLSTFVAEGTAKVGEMIRSTSKEKLGDDKTPLEVIPLTFSNTWVLTEKIKGKYEFRGMEPRTAKNETLPWEFKDKGSDWKRSKAIDLFALLPADIAAEKAEIEKAEKTGEMPDMTKCLLPVVIRFQNTGFKAGKHVVTHFTLAQNPSMAKFGVMPYSYSLVLKSIKTQNDKGTFFVFDVSRGAKASKDTIELAASWYDRILSQAVQVDESDEALHTNGASAPSVGDQY